MDSRRDRRMMTGIILIVMGAGFFALQFLEGFGDSVSTFVIGLAFLVAYLYRRSYGFLVPAGILLGIGMGSIGENSALSFEGIGSIGLGVGFLSIYVIDLAYTGSTSWWPLVPGAILVVIGLSEGSQVFRELLEVGWPILLILAGLVLLFGASEFRRLLQ